MDNKIRLNKFISNSGICSRRDADMHISIGSVKVNGKIVTEMGYKVNLDDEVRFDGAR
ncbi:MAG: pseudouridine synthase, partial [Flavobacteriaceae bacterium]|nr:pseudouridine synthase [Flavobacteriaceae bacterium]